jgi:FkbM family methyltransferase
MLVNRILWSVLQAGMDHAPTRVREAILEACFKSFGFGGVSARLLPRLGITEVGVWGSLGLIRSSWNDHLVLPQYARTGAVEAGIVKEIAGFFAGDPGTYIDVGANIGLTIIPIARDPSIRCIAFEPEPNNFRFLRLNVEENVKGNAVEFHNKAVFHTHGTVSLALADGNLGDHRVTVDGIPGRCTIDVEAVPLDDLLDRVQGKLAVKIDTQGAEPSVVAGGQKMLSLAGLLIMEFCPYLMRLLGGDPEVVISCLETFEQVALIEAGSDSEPRFVTVTEAREQLRGRLRTARDSDEDYFDIIARRDRS